MSNDKQPLVSILTPTWNRADYLSNVWDGLNSQTNKSIEWIIANDGSNDNTVETAKALAQKSEFPVTLINASVRIGKSSMDNEAVRCARGEFILWCDSDDVLLPNAVETLLATWASIPASEREGFAGVTALCDTKAGVLGDNYPMDDYSDINLNKLMGSLNSDLLIFTRSILLKSNPFLEVDYLIPESSVWCVVGLRKTRFVPIVLERKSYGESSCLSFTGLMEYSRGRAYALAVTRNVFRGKLTFRDKIWRIINFVRYSIHGEIPSFDAFRIWNAGVFDALTLLALSPVSFSLAVKDRLQGKVRKTHRDFAEARKLVEIECQELKTEAE